MTNLKQARAVDKEAHAANKRLKEIILLMAWFGYQKCVLHSNGIRYSNSSASNPLKNEQYSRPC